MRPNVKVFHESIRHKQTMFDVEVVVSFRHAMDFMPHEFAVVRMSALKHQVDRRLDRPVDSKYPIGFFRPDEVAAGDPPAKAPRDTESRPDKPRFAAGRLPRAFDLRYRWSFHTI